VTGLLFGYNAPSSPLPAPWIGGFEADIGFGDFVGHGNVCLTDCSSQVLPTFTYNFDWDAHLRLRAGNPMGNVMPFIAAGLAIAQVTVTENADSIDLGNRYFGGTIGAGVDVQLNPGVTGRVEALYDKYLRKTYDDYTVDLSGWTVRAALIWQFH
jgi:opacity protein-like surface antigen